MNTLSKGKIFLAEQRGMKQTEWFRSYYTFNFRDYYNEHKTVCNNVYVCNDDTIAPERELTMTVQEHSYVILIPVVGDIFYQDTNGNKSILSPGNMQLIKAGGLVFNISNPGSSALVNFLQIWLKADPEPEDTGTLQTCFNLNENKDRLVEIYFEESAVINHNNALPFVSIGKFGGRSETVYKLKDPKRGVFIYVIEGIFEVQGRLMHDRDALSLWDNVEEVEIEALSNDAIILIVEKDQDSGKYDSNPTQVR